MNPYALVEATDPELSDILNSELIRQEDEVELIASENYTSPAVLQTVGSVLTNKYAEGLPNRRYYGGCHEVDKAENLARKRARQLFMPEGFDIGVNVQPHSGAQANAAVFLALLNGGHLQEDGRHSGDTILGLALDNGGHLTHGSPVNSSGRLYRGVHYGLRPDGWLDMDHVREMALKEKPKLIICGASAYPRIIDFAAFRSIADEVGAYLHADIAHIAGLVATGHHPNPFPHCHVVTTTTHKTLRGPRGGLIMAERSLMKSINGAVFPGTQGGPLMHVVAGKAVAFLEASQPSFKTYSAQVLKNASVMAESLIERGYSLVSGGTDNHLMLIDLSEHSCSGKDAENLLGEAGITVNKNTVPNEKRSPFVTSGVRVGTPAITTRGMGIAESRQIAHWIADVLDSPENETLRLAIKNDIKSLCKSFPVYPHLIEAN
ncbi:MAG: serine hydroxymethyltransferase [Myxococcota bacterium]|nr:serine hydroxymethyltransferase [Myxococcota bacterium]